jgi:iron transport multicopper oxidase
MATSNLIIDSNGGKVNIPLTGTAGAPPQMVITPLVNDFGTVAAGVTKMMSFTVSNPGGTELVITKSKPPALGQFVAQTTLAEGSVIAAGQGVTETVTFSSTTTGSFSDVWVITGNDTSGVQNVTFNASQSDNAASGPSGATSGGATGTFGCNANGGRSQGGGAGSLMVCLAVLGGVFARHPRRFRPSVPVRA